MTHLDFDHDEVCLSKILKSVVGMDYLATPPALGAVIHRQVARLVTLFSGKHEASLIFSILSVSFVVRHE